MLWNDWYSAERQETAKQRWDRAHLRTISTRITTEQYKNLKQFAHAQGMTVYHLIKVALESYCGRL